MSNSVSTANMWPYYSKQSINTVEKSKDLGKDQFLKILMVQLQNQDPTQPLQDKDFIAQMAQFTSVEQLAKISDSLGVLNQSLGSASTIIGKNVSWFGEDTEGKVVTEHGKVDSVEMIKGIAYANIGDKKVSIRDLIKISE